jgi:uncharacterized protein (DUF2147 family)
MRRFLLSIAALLGATFIVTALAQNNPEGYWLTANGAIVEVIHCGEALCGKLAWFRIKPDEPNPQALDLKNPETALRNRPLCGLTIMSGLKPAGPSSWEDGVIYDPESGNTYHAKIELQADGVLRLRGYIGISLIGRSEAWTRYVQPIPPCPTR